MIADGLLANVIDLMVDAICVVDEAGHFLYASAAFERIFGYHPKEIIGRQMLDFVHPDDRDRTLGAVAHIVAGNDQLHFENRYLHRDGRVVHIMWSARWSPDHRFRVAVARDVTARKRAESMQAALYAISEVAHAAVDLATLCHRIDDIVAPLVSFGDLRVVVPRDERRRSDVGERAEDWSPGYRDTADPHDALARQVMLSGSQMAIDAESIHVTPVDEVPDGDRSIEWLGLPLRAHDHVIGALLFRRSTATARCTTAELALLHFASAQIGSAIERKNTEARLLHGAGHDPLTGLANRSLVLDRVTAALAFARRDGTDVWLLYMDIDSFKEVNDRLGHGVGDALLEELARRLRSCLRESDTVGRIGGDEFVVVLGKVKSPDDARSIAETIRLAACVRFELAGQSLSVSVSIGIARYPAHGHDYRHLLERADEAMYRSKKAGGNRITVALTQGESSG